MKLKLLFLLATTLFLHKLYNSEALSETGLAQEPIKEMSPQISDDLISQEPQEDTVVQDVTFDTLTQQETELLPEAPQEIFVGKDGQVSTEKIPHTEEEVTDSAHELEIDTPISQDEMVEDEALAESSSDSNQLFLETVTSN